MLLVVATAMLALVAAGVRAPGTPLARALADRILCAASLAGGCGDEPGLVAAYGSEVGALVRRHMPVLVFEEGSRAVPVDFRRCRSSECGDGPPAGLVHRTEAGLPVTAFVHVVDCRAAAAAVAEAAGADCSGERAGNLYVQYWTYYADSATLRGVPVAGERGYHRDDWEGVQLRFRPDGSVEERASSHDGYNSGATSYRNWGADAGVGPLKDAAEAVGARPVAAGAGRAISSSSPAAATPATPSTGPTPSGSPPTAAFTWSRSSRSPRPAPRASRSRLPG
jgi:hypothetical protein